MQYTANFKAITCDMKPLCHPLICVVDCQKCDSFNFKKLQIKHVNKRILQMRPPDFLTRLPRDMEKHFKNLKGLLHFLISLYNELQYSTVHNTFYILHVEVVILNVKGISISSMRTPTKGSVLKVSTYVMFNCSF